MQSSGRSSRRALSTRALSSSTVSSLATPKLEARARRNMVRANRRMAVISWQSSLLGLNGDQAMRGLPFLIGILPLRHLHEVMIIECGVFVVTQVVISGGAKKVTNIR